ncbi:MAG TPA: energy transducer TonB [Gemmatimonadales bacterium]|nr:energy transducer TonB [Gemmatimonadales bacterium]
MFDNLIESKRKADKKRVFGVGFFSMFMHSALVAAAVYATLGATETDAGPVVDTLMVYVQEQQQQQEEQPKVVQVDVQLKGFQTVVAPTSIPTDIPPINLEEKFDPRDYTGTGVEGGIGTGLVPSSDQVYAENVVEEKPDRLSGPIPEYPQLLRSAGIEGTVIVQVVIDTMGRAEPNSIKIIRSPNPGFDQPVKNAVLRTLFRPARVHGRAVRVLVQIPYNFTLKK